LFLRYGGGIGVANSPQNQRIVKQQVVGKNPATIAAWKKPKK